MALIRINHRPNRRQLLVFALAWAGFVGALGWAQWTKGRAPLAVGCWVLAVGVPLVGAAWREGLRRFYVGLSYATYPIGYVVSTVALVVIYYAVLTPLGLILRVGRHDPLQKNPAARAGSYWHPRPAARKPADYFRQH
jgi:hypothetical protein